MANSPAPRPNKVGAEAPDSAPAYGAEIALGVLALLALATAGACLGATVHLQRRQSAMNDELRAAREHAQALGKIIDCWQWTTDAQHRVIEMRPPHDASAEQWSAFESDEPIEQRPFLWECFPAGLTGTRSLRAKLAAHASLDESTARRTAADIQDDGSATTVPGDDEAPAASSKDWRLRAEPRFDSQGKFAGYIGTARPHAPQGSDAADGDAAGAATQAPDTAQMTADSEAFSYTVSHDLRAPIRVVEGFTKILKEDYGRQLDRVGNDHLDRVLGAASRMNSMIDALLSLAQLQATPLVRQPINLSQLAQYIVDDLRRQSPEREVTVHIEPAMQVLGDPTLLRIALENLLGNAWKYTAKRRLAQIWFESEPLENARGFVVRDNGAGFDMRFADRLFGVFQRLHSASDFQGTGVGLASVRRIIKRHEGNIWAESEPDCGARFHFTLPERRVH